MICYSWFISLLNNHLLFYVIWYLFACKVGNLIHTLLKSVTFLSLGIISSGSYLTTIEGGTRIEICLQGVAAMHKQGAVSMVLDNHAFGYDKAGGISLISWFWGMCFSMHNTLERCGYEGSKYFWFFKQFIFIVKT